MCDYLLYIGYVNLLLNIMVIFNSPLTLFQNPHGPGRACALEAPDARFSALGFPQDDTTIEVDICNQAVRLVDAPEESANILLVNTHSSRQFIVPAFT